MFHSEGHSEIVLEYAYYVGKSGCLSTSKSERAVIELSPRRQGHALLVLRLVGRDRLILDKDCLAAARRFDGGDANLSHLHRPH
jgi:hypothetical protein